MLSLHVVEAPIGVENLIYIEASFMPYMCDHCFARKLRVEDEIYYRTLRAFYKDTVLVELKARDYKRRHPFYKTDVMRELKTLVKLARQMRLLAVI